MIKIFFAAVFVLILFSDLVSLIRCERFNVNITNTPLYASPAEGTLSSSSDSTAPRAWLHVLVETDYGWLWQKSTAKAFTSSDKDGKQKIKVGKLCVKLEAHDIQQQCVENADSLVVSEKKRGIFIKKKRATMWAWAENPKLEMTSTFLDP